MDNKKKKVLIIIGKLYVGGAERVGRDIGYYADPARFEVHYIVFGPEIGAYEQGLLDKGCKIFHFDSPTHNHAAYYRKLLDLIRRERYDVIHSHTMFSSIWPLMAGKRCGVPIRIAHSHSIRGNEKRGFVKNTYENIMRRLVVRYATHCIGCGRSAGRWLFGKNAFDKKGILIYNGIDLSQFFYSPDARNRIRRSLGLQDRLVIGHAGHLAPVKNQGFLLELMPRILEQRSDAVLVLLGEGNDRAMLEEKIRQLNLSDFVILTGNVSGVGDYLSAMDVFAFPSFYEGMPLSMIEAQANGLPCVISNRIPQDVHLTDLVTALPLEGQQEQWVDALCAVRRTTPEVYGSKIAAMGFDTSDMLRKIYAIYEG